MLREVSPWTPFSDASVAFALDQDTSGRYFTVELTLTYATGKTHEAAHHLNLLTYRAAKRNLRLRFEALRDGRTYHKEA